MWKSLPAIVGRYRLAFVTVAGLTVGAYVTDALFWPRYVTSARFVMPSGTSLGEYLAEKPSVAVNEQFVATYLNGLRAGTILEQAAIRIGIRQLDAQVLRGSLRVLRPPFDNTVTVELRGNQPKDLQQQLRGVLDTYYEWLDATLKSDGALVIARVRQQLDEANKQLAAIASEAAGAGIHRGADNLHSRIARAEQLERALTARHDAELDQLNELSARRDGSVHRSWEKLEALERDLSSRWERYFTVVDVYGEHSREALLAAGRRAASELEIAAECRATFGADAHAARATADLTTERARQRGLAGSLEKAGHRASRALRELLSLEQSLHRTQRDMGQLEERKARLQEILVRLQASLDHSHSAELVELEAPTGAFRTNSLATSFARALLATFALWAMLAYALFAGMVRAMARAEQGHA